VGVVGVGAVVGCWCEAEGVGGGVGGVGGVVVAVVVVVGAGFGVSVLAGLVEGAVPDLRWFVTDQGPGVVAMCPIGSDLALDPEDAKGVLPIVEVAAGVGDVGSSGEAEGADRKVAEGCEGPGCGQGGVQSRLAWSGGGLAGQG